MPSQAYQAGGGDWLRRARQRSLAIYTQAAAHAAARGIIPADTKFEFGVLGRELLLADEVLTPDSSRLWPADQWRPGHNPPSFDKQYLRDLESLPWPRSRRRRRCRMRSFRQPRRAMKPR